ncbi:NINE protein [Lacinutrix chionoecetis]
MKIKLLLSFLVFFIGITTASASFPVKRTTTTVENTTNVTTDTVDAEMTSPAVMKRKDKTTAILLWVFLGGFAAHRWYLGSPIGWNILFILTGGFFIVGWIIDGIDIITDKYPGL